MEFLSHPLNYLLLYGLLPLLLGWFIWSLVSLVKDLNEYKKETGLEPSDDMRAEWSIPYALVLREVLKSVWRFITLQHNHDDDLYG